MKSFTAYLENRKKLVDKALKRCLPPAKTRPARIHEAMRYSIFGGGKRIRPILCLAACEALGGTLRQAMRPACALELIHTYSLIHDDLPCMDDDDLRRGRLTNHKVFGENTAVLAGDALLTLAFEILSKNGNGIPSNTTAHLVRVVANAAGSKKLIGGQIEDLEGERKKLTPAQLRFIHLNKTAALLQASVVSGALVAGASPQNIARLSRYGQSIGLAFQIADDILDVSGDERKMGKRVRKDKDKQKATYPRIVGMQASKALLTRLVLRAINGLKPLGPKADPLREMARFVASRDN